MAWNISLPSAQYFDQNTPGLQNLVNEASVQTEIAIDTETTGLVSWKDIPLYWSMAWGNKRFTLNASILPYFYEVFDNPNITWVLANAKYDMHMLANLGVELAGVTACTQVMHSLLYEDRSHKLKDMAMHLLGWRWSDFQDTFGKISVKKGVSAKDVINRAEKENFALLVEYAANDAWGTLHCWHELKKQLQEATTYSLFVDKPPHIETLWDLFWKVEAPYTKVLWTNERHGAKVNTDYLEQIKGPIQQELQDMEKELSRLAGAIINPNSNQDLQELFFSKLGLHPIKMTKGGKTGVRKPSTDAQVLERFAESGVEAAKLILKYRKLSKLFGTYVLGLQRYADPRDRIHTSFHQDVTRTGRLSSSGPNLQNIPSLENDVYGLRNIFIPERGNEMIVGDYSQLEMRLVAAAAMEEDMIGVFLKNWDIHMGNASLMFNIPYEDIKAAKDVDKKVKSGDLDLSAMTDYVHECLQARAAAKSIGFGMNYGMGAKKLAGTLNCSVREAKEKIARYKETYPAVSNFYQEAIQETEASGYAFTILGRRRSLPQIESARNDDRAEAERLAVNTPIQGSAADVCKMAQLLCHKAGLEERFGCKMLLQVHDELVFECPSEYVAEAKMEIKEWMEHPFVEDLPVPLTVEIGTGPSWGSAK